jgi:serine/threonine-protein phosphatase 6 regulatory subunit 3
MLTMCYNSPINDILEKEHFTLEELLEENDLLQEVKARNDKLLEL